MSIGSKLKPVEAHEDWLRSAAVETGPVFRSIQKGGSVNLDRLSEGSVADIGKHYAKAAGLDPETFSGHSLRAGFVISALEAGADLLKVMDVTRHREVKTLKAYDRRAKAFKNHAGKGFL
jgi:site-specific recombinase XerD